MMLRLCHVLAIAVIAMPFADACAGYLDRGTEANQAVTEDGKQAVQAGEPQNNEEDIPKEDVDAVQSLLGPKVSLKEYDPMGYELATGGPVNNGDPLTCDFEMDCCWSNSPDPMDQLEWAVAMGEPGDAELEKLWGWTPEAGPKPQGAYLLTLAAAEPADEAHFHSCSIPCTKSEITVTMKHWQTANVLLQVCTRASFFQDPFAAPLLHCRELPYGEVETAVTLPAGKNLDVVIVASNLVADQGDGAIVDDISVSYTECSASENDAATAEGANPNSAIGTGDNTESNDERERPNLPRGVLGSGTERGDLTDHCKQVPCTFENDMCAWTDVVSAGVPDFEATFGIVNGGFMNPVTGVPRSSGVSKYAASYLEPGQRSALITLVDVTETIVVSVNYYSATRGLVVSGCCDTPEQCPLSTDGMATHSDRQWMNTKFSCPPGTMQLVFLCDNGGKSEGACAFDNIEAFAMPTEDVNDMRPCAENGVSKA